jgi:ribonuclease/clavin/mitogillin
MLQAARHGPISRIVLARTFFGRALYTVAIYLVDGLLIDSGPPVTARQLGRWLHGQGVEQIINTHHHEDHSGGNRWLQQALRVPVRVPPGTVPLLAHFPRLEAYRRLVWGQPANFGADSLREVVESSHYRFQVIPTPGHCPDHVCLFEPEQGWLFSGDLYIQERARYLRADVNLYQLMESLQHVLTLRPRLLLCCHAGIIEDASGAIERKLAYWDQLRVQVQDLHQAGLSAREIRDRLLGPEGTMTRITRGHFSKMNLVRALLGEGDTADH